MRTEPEALIRRRRRRYDIIKKYRVKRDGGGGGARYTQIFILNVQVLYCVYS